MPKTSATILNDAIDDIFVVRAKSMVNSHIEQVHELIAYIVEVGLIRRRVEICRANRHAANRLVSNQFAIMVIN
jgi:hypothetical protein